MYKKLYFLDRSKGVVVRVPGNVASGSAERFLRIEMLRRRSMMIHLPYVV